MRTTVKRGWDWRLCLFSINVSILFTEEGATVDAAWSMIVNVRIWLPIRQCAWCKGIKVGRWYVRASWIPLLSGQRVVRLPLLRPIMVGITHGACPSCAAIFRDASRNWLAEHRPPSP